MKCLTAVASVGALLLCGQGSAQTSGPGEAKTASSTSVPARQTPAEQRIDGARRQIGANPKKVGGFNDLAVGYLRRARETADAHYLIEAERAVSQGLQVDPKDFSLQKTKIAVLLAEQRFSEARDQANALHKRTPDDAMLYGYVAEAAIELGDYAEAERSAQWMLNLLPNNVPGLLLGARLRLVYGDAEGAQELLDLAYSETSPTEVEELAWIGNRTAEVDLAVGKLQAAAAVLDRAETLFPHDPYTTENVARLRVAQHRAAEAAILFEQAASVDHDPAILFELAEAETAAGAPVQAEKDYLRFRSAMAAGSTTSAARRDLIFLDARESATAARASEMAQTEARTRHDVWTLDACAWALYANGRYAEADAAIQRVLAVGIQDAGIFDHAGQIAKKLGRQQDVAKYSRLARQLDGSSAEVAQAASPVAREGSVSVSTPMHTLLSDAGGPAFAPLPAALLVPKSTETDRVIRTAQARVARSANDAAGLAVLGAAYFQQARETGDVESYQLAEQALAKSLDLVSSDFSADAALGTMAEVCMGEHRFADALMYSQKALALGSGDVSPFAIVGDAYADMGEYEKAASAYARLTPREMTLSPRAAYARDSRLSYLKFIMGDTPGAIALMREAVGEGTEAQLPGENLAWLYYELGEYLTQAGDPAAADKAYTTALTIHPGDYRALAGLGKLRANRGSYAEAITLYQRAIAIVPMPLFVAELGDLYRKTGNEGEAKKQFQLVEYIGLLGTINQILHNRDLAIFYADHGTKLPEALKLAQREFEVRHDVYTWDALAWALYRNGKVPEAAKASEQALRFGTRDALLHFHAGMIAQALGERLQAKDELTKALQINSNFHLVYAVEARQKLASLDAQATLEKGGSLQ